MQTQEPISNKKPTKPFDHTVKAPGGLSIDFHGDEKVAGAWMKLDGHDRSLSLVSVNQGGRHQNYIGYRDGQCQCDRLAVCVDENGQIWIHVVVPGQGDEYSRVRFFPLEELDRLALQATTAPA